eukprot:924771-Amphidinium_carterae.1
MLSSILKCCLHSCASKCAATTSNLVWTQVARLVLQQGSRIMTLQRMGTTLQETYHALVADALKSLSSSGRQTCAHRAGK